MYGTEDELARILKIRTPSAEQSAAMTRVLEMATNEVDHEIGLEPTDTPLADAELDTATQVALQRGAELWGLQEWPLGLAGIGSEFGSTSLARNSWDKYVFTLAPLKRKAGWGIA